MFSGVIDFAKASNCLPYAYVFYNVFCFILIIKALNDKTVPKPANIPALIAKGFNSFYFACFPFNAIFTK
jgi:hypothetical protein